eukprot:7381114-Prymnesium_polylepis.1
MANLEDPRAELKKKGEIYAGYIVHGVPKSRCKPFELPPDGATDEFIAKWSGQSFWSMWAQSRGHQFFLLQWAMQNGSDDLKAIVKFMGRISCLPNQPLPSALTAIAGDLKPTVDAAKGAIDALHKATRTLPYTADFTSALAPILSAVPGAETTCKVRPPRHAWSAAVLSSLSARQGGRVWVGMRVESGHDAGGEDRALIQLRTPPRRRSATRQSGRRSSCGQITLSTGPRAPSTSRRPPSRCSSASVASVSVAHRVSRRAP